MVLAAALLPSTPLPGPSQSASSQPLQLQPLRAQPPAGAATRANGCEAEPVPGWRVLDGKLHRSFRFASFVEAFGFMTRVALIAERLGHHPEWSNIYDRVTIALITHDRGGIGELDREFARRVNALVGPRGEAPTRAWTSPLSGC